MPLRSADVGTMPVLLGVRLAVMLGLLALILAPALALAGGGDDNRRAPPNRLQGETPSGLPVPRYVSLKEDLVRGRMGPSTDYPVAWVYRRRGLPVRVIAETEHWRRIEDPAGQRAWVARWLLSGEPTAIVQTPDRMSVALTRRPDPGSRVVANLSPGVVVRVEDSRPGWLRVKADRFVGWLPQSAVWGAD